MTTPWLCGNCEPCPACALRREALDLGAVLRPDVPCNVCRGTGLVALSDVEIVRRTCDEARRIYWPDFERRIAAGLGLAP